MRGQLEATVETWAPGRREEGAGTLGTAGVEGLLDLDADDQLLADAVDRWVRRHLDVLREEARTVQALFEAQLRAAGKGRHRSEWGLISVRVREQPSPPATPGSFTLEWCTYNFAHRASATACFTKYIPKGDGDRYPMSAFQGKVRNWQRPIVAAAETRFAAIRRAVRQIAGTRTQLRLAVRTERAVLETLSAGQDDWGAGV